MDSFLNQQRVAPEPSSLESFSFTPSVPEVSMISTTKTCIEDTSTENVWKVKYQQVGKTNAQNNFIPLGYKNFQTQFTKKQVRFESPVLQQQSNFSHTPPNKMVPISESKNYQEFNSLRKQQTNIKDLNSPKPFHQIYMANIPDRKLDLSIIDIGSRNNAEKQIDVSAKTEKIQDAKIRDNLEEPNKENHMPKTYQEFLELQKEIAVSRKIDHNDSVTDIFNYKRSSPKCNQSDSQRLNRKQQVLHNIVQQRKNESKNDIVQQINNDKKYDECRYKPPNYPTLNSNVITQKCDIETQTCIDETVDSKAIQNKTDYEPSNKDLLKIIAQQNEQLLLLQRQVAMLLDRDRNYPKPICSENVNYEETQHGLMSSSPNKNHFRQENTITKQASIFQDNQRKWGMSKFSINLTTSFEMPLRNQQKQNYINHKPKIEKIAEVDLSPKSDSIETSLHLQEPMNVQEQCPSPQPSIVINMDDYESSDDEEAISEIGTTFYNNILGQVNNMLTKAKEDNDDLNCRTQEDKSESTQMLNKVKEATLKHFKNMGVTLGPVNEDFTTSKDGFTPSELNCNVNQLLEKYLPPNQLRQQSKPNLVNQGCNAGIMSPKHDFSLASLDYMRKYNLIASKEKVPDFIQPQKMRTGNVDLGSKKILDLTALKMQPKLL